MFEVGFTEIVLILGLALLVLGPEKLPGLAQKVGRWTGRARSMARQLRTQLEQEVTLEEMAKSRPPPPPPPSNEPSSSASAPETPMAPEEPYSPPHPPHDIGLDSAASDIEPHAESHATAPATPAPSETDPAKPHG